MSKLDLVFICDCTGSMGSYIHAAKTNIETIITKIIQFEQADVRFALVEYRDHPPEDRTFAFRLTDFTTSLKNMKEAVNQMEADGGGDGPESVCCAFNCAVNLEWREEATKIIIWIADAPPHGFTKHGDGFPDGCPCKCDLIQEVRKCVDNDILIYSVGTEPLSVAYLRTLMRTVSELTNGQYVALSSAELLSDLIINGCREEIQMKRILDEVKTRLESSPDFNELNELERESRIDSEVNEISKNMKIDTVVIDSIFENELDPIPDLFLTCQSLKELKSKMYNTPDIKAIVKRVNNRYDEYIPEPRMHSMCYESMPPPDDMMELHCAFGCRAPPTMPSMRFSRKMERPEKLMNVCQTVSSCYQDVDEIQQLKLKKRINCHYEKKSGKKKNEGK